MKRQTRPQFAARRREIVRLAWRPHKGWPQTAIASHRRIPLCPSAKGTLDARIDGFDAQKPPVCASSRIVREPYGSYCCV